MAADKRLAHPTPYRIAVALALVWLAMAHASSDVEYANVGLGTDPQRFTTAETMYSVAPVKPFDSTAQGIIDNIDAKIKSGLDPASVDVRQLLIDLNHYRSCPEVQAAVPQWVIATAERLNAGYAPADGTLINTQYIDGRFEEASKVYQELLHSAPKHFDARNNLALSDLHQGYDLSAQVELELLRQINRTSVSTLVNLTVVYERMGESAKARALADEALAKATILPQANYNVAWYLELEKKFAPAAGLLNPMLQKHRDSQHQALSTLISRETGALVSPSPLPSPSPLSPDQMQRFWSTGLVGLLDGRSSTEKIVVSAFVFLLVTLIVIRITGAVGKSGYPNQGHVATFLFGLIGGGFYSAYWGIPTGGGVVLLVLYLVVGSFYAASIANGR